MAAVLLVANPGILGAMASAVGLRARAEEGRTVEVFCECGDAGCAERVAITREAYERLRADPESFVLARNIGEAASIAVDGDRRHATP